MSLLWEDSEVPDNCFFKALTHVLGDQALCASPLLPIEHSKAQIEEAIMENNVVAVQAPTSSGKSMKIPLFMYDLMNPPPVIEKYPILVVQQSNFAAEKMVESLVDFLRVAASSDPFAHRPT